MQVGPACRAGPCPNRSRSASGTYCMALQLLRSGLLRTKRSFSMNKTGRLAPARSEEIRELIAQVRKLALPLRTPDDLDPLMNRIADARYVLLGEASHGTAEYYLWRTRITQRLIREKGFSFLAVEGDWPDCYQVNRYVKGLADAG